MAINLMTSDLDLISHIQYLFEMRLVLYGSSTCAKDCIRIIRESNIQIDALADSNPDKWGNYVEDIKIISPEELKMFCRTDKVQVVIASGFIQEILNKMMQEEINPVKIYSAFGLKYAVFMNYRNNCFKASWKTNFNKKYQEYNDVKQVMQSAFWTQELGDYILNSCKYKEPILVYQCGKVGSCSIWDSLIKMGICSSHMHSLTTMIDGCKEEYRNLRERFLMKMHDTQKIKIITLVREPISRDISAFFQSIDKPYHLFQKEINIDLCEKCIHGIESFVRDDMGVAQDQLWGENFPKFNYGYQFNWFERNINRFFDINVYDYPFDQDKGYSVIETNHIDILIMQLEKLNQLQDIIAKFLGIKEFVLINSNESKSKEYYYTYLDVLRNIKIPEYILKFYYQENKGMKHFYSERDIECFFNKWKGYM